MCSGRIALHWLGRMMYVFLLLSLTVSSSIAQQSAVQVRAEAVLLQSLQERHQVTGNLRAVNRSRIASLEEGRVLSVEVNEADAVKKGHILAKLDDRRLKAQMQGLEAQKRVIQAQKEARQAELANAQWNLSRLRSLWENKMTTEQSFKDAETSVTVAVANVAVSDKESERIDSEIDLLQIRLQDMVIYAPFQGRVVERHTEPGEWISAGDTIATIVSTGLIEAWLEVPERYAAHVINVSSEIHIDVIGTGDAFTTSNAQMVPQIDPRVRTFFLISRLNAEKTLLTPGMSITAWIPTGEQGKHITVPKNAVMRDNTGTYVFKVQKTPEGQIAVPTPITIQFETDTHIIVAGSALAPGDQVVVEGNERLRPMMPIAIIQ